MLALQVRFALGGVGQLFPQKPQWFSVVASGTSQPSAGFPLQSPKPESQVKPQLPATHVVVELARFGQAFGHEPQCRTSVLRLTSQPSTALPLQSAKPALQVNPQVEPVQVRVEFGRLAQRFPQKPQSSRLPTTLTSQPSAGFPLQSSQPALQVKPQLEPVQQGGDGEQDALLGETGAAAGVGTDPEGRDHAGAGAPDDVDTSDARTVDAEVAIRDGKVMKTIAVEVPDRGKLVDGNRFKIEIQTRIVVLLHRSVGVEQQDAQ